MTQPTRFVPVALWIPSFEGMTRRLLNSLRFNFVFFVLFVRDFLAANLRTQFFIQPLKAIQKKNNTPILYQFRVSAIAEFGSRRHRIGGKSEGVLQDDSGIYFG